MSIGKTIRFLRIGRSISQGKLARNLGVTASYLSLVEHEKREPSLAFLKKVAQHFDVPVGFLLLHDVSADRLKPRQKKLFLEIRRNLLDYVLSPDFLAEKSK